MSRTPSISRSVLAVLATVALAACERSATAPSPAPDAPQLAVSFNETDLPFSFDVPGCTEVVHVTGKLHVVLATTIGPNGRAMDRFHTNSSGTGVGLTTGATYRWSDPINGVETTQPDSPRVASHTQTTTLVGQGGVPNLKFRARFLMMRNDAGQVTVLVQEFEILCG